MPDEVSFKCPHCEAMYRVVRVEMPPGRDRPLECRSCGGPLQARYGKFSLKYIPS